MDSTMKKAGISCSFWFQWIWCRSLMVDTDFITYFSYWLWSYHSLFQIFVWLVYNSLISLGYYTCKDCSIFQLYMSCVPEVWFVKLSRMRAHWQLFYQYLKSCCFYFLDYTHHYQATEKGFILNNWWLQLLKAPFTVSNSKLLLDFAEVVAKVIDCVNRY